MQSSSTPCLCRPAASAFCNFNSSSLDRGSHVPDDRDIVVGGTRRHHLSLRGPVYLIRLRSWTGSQRTPSTTPSARYRSPNMYDETRFHKTVPTCRATVQGRMWGRTRCMNIRSHRTVDNGSLNPPISQVAFFTESKTCGHTSVFIQVATAME